MISQAGSQPSGTAHPATWSAHAAWPVCDPRSARVAWPVCDPRLPAAFRRWARRQRPVFNSRGELAVLVPGGRSGGARPAAIGCWLLTVVFMILLITEPLSLGRAGWLAVAAATAIAGATVQHRASRRDLRLCRSNVIFPEKLDEICRALLGRAQQAIATIVGSDVHAAGLLANPVDDNTLRHHEWEIAGQLREITTLRALLVANTTGTAVGPMTTGVLSAQQRAIELAQEASTARIEALERYASQITAADAAERDWQQAVKLSKLNDKYLDLVARTAADDHAASEIAAHTEQLAAATQARNARLHEADLAATALLLTPR
jgi:hypothetical protein